MARKPRSSKAGQSSCGLLKALNFVSVAQKKKGSAFQTHCIFKNNTVTAFDGRLSAGHSIEEDLNATPQTQTFTDALKLCGDTLTITQLDKSRLAVKSGKFNAFVPCHTEEMPTIEPDPPQALLDNRLIDGFRLISNLADEETDKVATSTILVKAGSMVATNGFIVVEFWHGIDLPYPLIIPKEAVAAVLKIDKKLAKFGFSTHTFTFYFDDNSWIKTQLLNGDWPNTDQILNVDCNPWPLFTEFYKAVNALEKFTTKDRIYFKTDKVEASLSDKEGASFEIPGLPEGPIFSINQLKLIEGMFDRIDFISYKDKSYFFGENLRGAIMRCRE